MDGKKWSLAAAVLVGLWAAADARAAWPFVWWRQAPDCQCSAYSPLHYWVPSIYRTAAFHCTPEHYIYARDFYPGTPISTVFDPYHCRAISPGVYSGDHYLPVIGSNYPDATTGDAGTTAPSPTPPPGAGTTPERQPEKIPPPKSDKPAKS